MDGTSLLPIVQGDSGSTDRHVVSVFASNLETCHQLAITDGRWKYLWFPEGPSEQLFDLQADPQERHNLAGAEAVADVQANLHQSIIDELTAKNSPFVKQGKLVQHPERIDPPGFRASRTLPGYLLNDSDRDSRH